MKAESRLYDYRFVAPVINIIGMYDHPRHVVSAT